jgi:hypothetical protein
MVTDITPFKMIPGTIRDRDERFEIAGIGKLIEVHHAVITMLDQMADNRGADEPCPTRNNNCFQTRSRE